MIPPGGMGTEKRKVGEERGRWQIEIATYLQSVNYRDE
jgi:hypothetical protein